MIFTVLLSAFLLSPFSMGVQAKAQDGDILSRLKTAYTLCDQKPDPKDAYKCRNDAYKLEARNFCRGSLENCFNDSKNSDLRLMDPFRCFNPKKCEFLTNGDAKLSYQFEGGRCDKETQRTELTDAYKVKAGEAVEYNMNMALPPNGDLQVPSLLVAQFKASSGNSPPLALRYKRDGKLTVSLRQSYRADVGNVDYSPGAANGNFVEEEVMKKVTPGQPLKIKIQIQPGPNGFARLEIDGKTVWGWDGPVGYPPDPTDKNSANYFKIGPYDHSCKQTKPISIVYGGFQNGRVKDKLPLPESAPKDDSPAPILVNQ